MPSLTDNLGWGAVDRIETTDLALGGNETNAPNRMLRQLASRDKWLFDQLGGDAIASFNAFRDIGMSAIAQGRLTLATGEPLPSSDQLAKTTLYYTPDGGDLIAYYDGAAERWKIEQFPELVLPLAGLSASTNYDIFLTRTGADFGLEAVAWSNSGAGSSARNQAIGRRNGVLVKTADNRRLLGTIRTTSTGQTEDSRQRRLVWNVHNKRVRTIAAQEPAAAWTYTTTAWRYVNNNSNNKIEVVCGDTSWIELTHSAHIYKRGMIGIGENSSTASISFPAVSLEGKYEGPGITIGTSTSRYPKIGYSYYSMIEVIDNAGIIFGGGATFFGVGELSGSGTEMAFGGNLSGGFEC